MKKRAALLSAGIAVGAVVAGVAGRAAVRRRAVEPSSIGDVPHEDLGSVVSFDGTRLAVRAAGDPSRPVIVLSHGFSLDMSVWCRVWPELSRDFRVIAFDHRSHGRSEHAAHGDLSLRAMGRDLAAVVKAVAPDGSAIVVGHSMGAMAVLAAAEQLPELFGRDIAGVALIGAASSNLLGGAMGSVTEFLRPSLGSLSAVAERVDRLRRALLASPSDVSGVVARVTQFGPDAPRHGVDHVVALARSTASEVWTDALPGLMQMDLRHAVPRIGVPAVVVVGEHDRVTPPAAAVSLAGELPEGRLAVLEGAGHIPMLEKPEELSAELVTFARATLRRPKPGTKKGKKGAA